MKIILTDIHGIIIIMSLKLRVFPIFRSNYENNLDRNIGPREKPKFSRHYVKNYGGVDSPLSIRIFSKFYLPNTKFSIFYLKFSQENLYLR